MCESKSKRQQGHRDGRSNCAVAPIFIAVTVLHFVAIGSSTRDTGQGWVLLMAALTDDTGIILLAVVHCQHQEKDNLLLIDE